MAEQARPQKRTTMQPSNMTRAKRNRVKIILASMVANSPRNSWSWQLLWFYLVKKIGLKVAATANDDSCGVSRVFEFQKAKPGP